MKYLTLLFLVLTFISCSKDTQPVTLSFYYWKTNFELNTYEQNVLKEEKVSKLYIRYFDVGIKNKQPIPIAPIVFNNRIPVEHVIPVIYIKNEVFLQENGLDSLPVKIYKYIQQINQNAGVSVNEIQFDCDWSLKSKDNYFAFLKEFKKYHENLSATIRLHQVKYPEKTGIPPVKKGVLMYYNMGVISADNNNSIYDRNLSKKYLASFKNYPLPLNIALPIFSWGVHTKQQQVSNLIGGLKESDLNKENFIKIANKRYKVINDVVFEGRYLAKDDEIKIEDISQEQLIEIKKDLKVNLKTIPEEILLYDLTEKNVKNYEKEIYKNLGNW